MPKGSKTMPKTYDNNAINPDIDAIKSKYDYITPKPIPGQMNAMI